MLTNLFGTPGRVAWGMGAQDVSALRETGELLASLLKGEALARFVREQLHVALSQRVDQRAAPGRQRHHIACVEPLAGQARLGGFAAELPRLGLKLAEGEFEFDGPPEGMARRPLVARFHTTCRT